MYLIKLYFHSILNSFENDCSLYFCLVRFKPLNVVQGHCRSIVFDFFLKTMVFKPYVQYRLLSGTASDGTLSTKAKKQIL